MVSNACGKPCAGRGMAERKWNAKGNQLVSDCLLPYLPSFTDLLTYSCYQGHNFYLQPSPTHSFARALLYLSSHHLASDFRVALQASVRPSSDNEMAQQQLPAVGTRIAHAGYLGTVNFVGQVDGTQGLWLGVEWDDPSRGRHSGAKDGRQYFTCL